MLSLELQIFDNDVFLVANSHSEMRNQGDGVCNIRFLFVMKIESQKTLFIFLYAINDDRKKTALANYIFILTSFLLVFLFLLLNNKSYF